ncbi:MAG: hypothetical protein ABW073_09405 [Acidimicrobiia bacterium]
MNKAENAAFVVVVLVWFGVWRGAGYLVGKSRGRAGTGAILGVLLGIFGILITLLLSPRDDQSRDTQRRRSERAMADWEAQYGDQLD